VSNVEAIKSAARHLADQGKCLSDNRVFISDVVDALLPQNPGWTEAQIKEAMRTMDRTVMFATGDLLDAYDATKLARSRTVVNTYRDHAVFVIPL
jgi:hypothetical protein